MSGMAVMENAADSIEMVTFPQGSELMVSEAARKNGLFITRYGADATFRTLGMDNASRNVVQITRHAYLVHVEVLSGREKGRQTKITTAFLSKKTGIN